MAAQLRELQDQVPAVETGSYPGKFDEQYRLLMVVSAMDAKLFDAVCVRIKSIVQSLGGRVSETP